jgi:hypothetical protein
MIVLYFYLFLNQNYLNYKQTIVNHYHPGIMRSDGERKVNNYLSLDGSHPCHTLTPTTPHTCSVLKYMHAAGLLNRSHIFMYVSQLFVHCLALVFSPSLFLNYVRLR